MSSGAENSHGGGLKLIIRKIKLCSYKLFNWTYNMKIHYEQSHNHITVPKNIGDEERVECSENVLILI